MCFGGGGSKTEKKPVPPPKLPAMEFSEQLLARTGRQRQIDKVNTQSVGASENLGVQAPFGAPAAPFASTNPTMISS